MGEPDACQVRRHHQSADGNVLTARRGCRLGAGQPTDQFLLRNLANRVYHRFKVRAAGRVDRLVPVAVVGDTPSSRGFQQRSQRRRNPAGIQCHQPNAAPGTCLLAGGTMPAVPAPHRTSRHAWIMTVPPTRRQQEADQGQAINPYPSRPDQHSRTTRGRSGWVPARFWRQLAVRYSTTTVTVSLTRRRYRRRWWPGGRRQ